MDLLVEVLLPAAVAAGFTMLIMPQVMRLAWRLRALDLPGGRKRQSDAIPRVGGIGIVGGIAVAWLVTTSLPTGIPPMRFDAYSGRFMLAVLIVFLLGVVDDLRGLGAFAKFSVQSVAALLVMQAGWQFTSLRLPLDVTFQLGFLAPVLTILWIVGVTNAINLIDGLDGLASGIVAIISGSLLVIAAFHESTDTVLMTSAMLGACLGFLRHNWIPAKIYMGDCGSLTLGFLLATVSLGSTPSLKASTAVTILVPILALGLPVIDTLMVMWYRFLRGHRLLNRVARMFRADRSHLHHILVDSSSRRSWVMMTLYGLAIVFCAMAVIVATSRSWILGVIFILVEVVAVALIRRAGLMSGARRLARQRRDRIDSGDEGKNQDQAVRSSADDLTVFAPKAP